MHSVGIVQTLRRSEGLWSGLLRLMVCGQPEQIKGFKTHSKKKGIDKIQHTHTQAQAHTHTHTHTGTGAYTHTHTEVLMRTQ